MYGNFENPKLTGATALEVFAGACIGLLGAGVAAIFARYHKKLMGWYKANGLLPNDMAIQRALVGSVVFEKCLTNNGHTEKVKTTSLPLERPYICQ